MSRFSKKAELDAFIVKSRHAGETDLECMNRLAKDKDPELEKLYSEAYSTPKSPVAKRSDIALRAIAGNVAADSIESYVKSHQRDQETFNKAYLRLLAARDPELARLYSISCA